MGFGRILKAHGGTLEAFADTWETLGDPGAESTCPMEGNTPHPGAYTKLTDKLTYKLLRLQSCKDTRLHKLAGQQGYKAAYLQGRASKPRGPEGAGGYIAIFT